jgi:acyl CoA:acetate/3-ketoacid CoA transferase beta subunit
LDIRGENEKTAQHQKGTHSHSASNQQVFPKNSGGELKLYEKRASTTMLALFQIDRSGNQNRTMIMTKEEDEE